MSTKCPHLYVDGPTGICNNCGEYLMVNDDVKSMVKMTDPRIIQFALSQLKFWEPIEFEGKLYYRTFQDNVYLIHDDSRSDDA